MLNCLDSCPGTPLDTPVDGNGCSTEGACCFAAGFCIDDTDPDNCELAAGSPQGGGTTCEHLCRIPGLGDRDGDGDVDDNDYRGWFDCIGWQSVPLFDECDLADLARDGSVDLLDFAELQVGFSG